MLASLLRCMLVGVCCLDFRDVHVLVALLVRRVPSPSLSSTQSWRRGGTFCLYRAWSGRPCACTDLYRGGHVSAPTPTTAIVSFCTDPSRGDHVHAPSYVGAAMCPHRLRQESLTTPVVATTITIILRQLFAYLCRCLFFGFESMFALLLSMSPFLCRCSS